jgi:hypothetical protein
MIERIVFYPADASAQVNAEEVLDLMWVFVRGRSDGTCDIPTKSHRFAELCHVLQRGDRPVELNSAHVTLPYASRCYCRQCHAEIHWRQPANDNQLQFRFNFPDEPPKRQQP